MKNLESKHAHSSPAIHFESVLDSMLHEQTSALESSPKKDFVDAWGHYGGGNLFLQCYSLWKTLMDFIHGVSPLISLLNIRISSSFLLLPINWISNFVNSGRELFIYFIYYIYILLFILGSQHGLQYNFVSGC